LERSGACERLSQMSATQVILVALVLVAFVLGWVARGRREAADPDRAGATASVGELDAAIGATLTAFQAVLALWQVESASGSPLAKRACAAFDQRRTDFETVARRVPGRLLGHDAIARARAAVDRLSQGLGAYAQGAVLDPDRERSLLRAERELTAARSAMLLAAVES
jgi:hypothetical protein